MLSIDLHTGSPFTQLYSTSTVSLRIIKFSPTKMALNLYDVIDQMDSRLIFYVNLPRRIAGMSATLYFQKKSTPLLQPGHES